MEKSQRYNEVEKMIEEAKAGTAPIGIRVLLRKGSGALELMRQKAYGYDPATARLQRVFEVAQLKKD
jgi:hypothetical protein